MYQEMTGASLSEISELSNIYVHVISVKLEKKFTVFTKDFRKYADM